MSRSRVAAVLAGCYPDWELAAVEPVTQGHRRQTVVARFSTADPVVVQFASDPRAVRTEAALARAIRERTSVPVAAPLHTGTHDGTAYLVSEYRPGADLHTRFSGLAPDHQRRLAERFGRSLAELHAAFTFEGCGELAPGDDASSLVAPATDCDDWLVAYGLRAVERLPSAFDPLRERLVDRLRNVPTGAGRAPRLFPWDLRPGNALLDDGDVSAIVDWERPLAGPPALAVAKTEYLVADWYVEDPAPLRAALRQGYEQIRDVPPVRPAHRVAAIADSAVDSRELVTNPRYPEVDREASVAFHREALERAVSD